MQREFVLFMLGAALVPAITEADTVLPIGQPRKPVAIPHFPDRMHAFIWRNWTVVDIDRLADVLGTTVGNVAAVAESMGLPPPRAIPPEFKTRGYITILKRNWHLLPYEQILPLLGMSADQLALALREDDFLFHKLGAAKPQCEPLRYAPPDEKAKNRAAEIRQIVRDAFGDEIRDEEPRFQFVSRLAAMSPAWPLRQPEDGLRYIYSYFAMYGDPLMTPELDPFPDGLLQRLAGLGINGVWIHTVLRQLAPSTTFPEFGEGHETRLANLRKLVRRAQRFGIRVYLYMNEPRAMTAAFFAERPQMKGVQEGDYFAMCTSAPEVRQWLVDSLAHVFQNVPDLGGVFTITASENLTNCASHHQEAQCPRCKAKTGAAIIADVNAAIEAGVHRGSPDAKVIVWDWGWKDDAAPAILAALPKSCWFMSVSEWSIPIERGGIRTETGEYSLSVVGPGPRATRHWKLARDAGLKTVAKIQANNTWELSAVPYLPALDLVAEHCGKLAAIGIDGMMLSWTLGGYPSPNLAVAQRLSRKPTPDPKTALDELARERFGLEGAACARRAWTAFSDALREYPYHQGVIYACPVQVGPANLLYPEPTGYGATMVGFPYDDVTSWRGPYPADVFASQFEKVADGWSAGLPELRDAVRKAPSGSDQEELPFAEAAFLHFRSVANQVRFTLARDVLLAKDKPPAPADRERYVRQVRRIVYDEIEAARRLFALARLDSRIGYEASNHYYYVPIDLVEKVINCRYVLDHAMPGEAR